MAGISSGTAANAVDVVSGSQEPTSNYKGSLFIVTVLFFMWGFITCLNDILIPKLQEVFTLQNWQAMLIQTAFFGAYFIVSLLYFTFSVTKGDPIMKIGYKNGIIAGLVVAAIGCGLLVENHKPVDYYAVASWELSDQRFRNPAYFQEYVHSLVKLLSAEVKIKIGE